MGSSSGGRRRLVFLLLFPAALGWNHPSALMGASRHAAVQTPRRALPAAAADKKRAGKRPLPAGKGFGAPPVAAPPPAELARGVSTASAVQPVPAVAGLPGWERLRPWLEARGATCDGITVGVVDVASGLRGVLTTRAFERGEPIFKVPREAAILDEARADASPVGAVWVDCAADVPACVRVALLVLYLQAACSAATPSSAAASSSTPRAGAAPDDGDWSPALAMLPTRAEFEADGGPLELWSAAEVARCECAQLVGEVGARSAELAALYDGVLLPGWQRAASAPGSPLAGIAPPSFERVQWAVVAVSSRAYGEGPPGGGTSSMLVPGVDLCNHAPPAEANTVKALAPWGDFVVIAARPLAAGEEVTITYGPLPNRRLLQQFGFMLPPGCAAQRALDVALARIDRLWAAAGGGDGWAEALPEPAQQALASLGREGLLVTGKSGRVSQWQPCGAKLQAAVARLESGAGAASYAELLRRELGAYPSGPDPHSDEALLSGGGGPLEPRARLAADFRARAKRLLLDALAAAESGRARG